MKNGFSIILFFFVYFIKASYFGCDPGEYLKVWYDGHKSCPSCTQGNYCPGGTIWFDDSARNVNYGINQCTVLGYYCGSRTITETEDECDYGYYCPSPAQNNPCTAGFYCPNKKMTSTDGYKCPTGYYCPEGSSTFAGNLCQDGYYCPEGSSIATQNPCPAGSYCPNYAASPVICPAGSYCLELSVGITGKCAAGFYCPNEGSPSSTQNQCPPGKVCALGTITPKDCKVGSYCPLESSIENDCGSGYFCANPSIKKQCSSGFYCPTSRESEETICPAGKYCATSGLSTVSGDCQAGYFCPAGSTSKTQNKCSETQYCPTGSAIPQECKCNGMGSCSQSNSSDCSCFEGSSGDYCEIFSCFDIPNDESSSCGNHGNCKTMDFCVCDEGYFGRKCDDWTCFGIVQNHSSVCYGKGKCSKFDTCDCYSGWIGEDCSVSVAGSIVVPIIGVVTGSIFIVLLCLTLITLPVVFLIVKQKQRLKEFDKYEDEINLIKLEELDREENEATFKLSKKYMTIQNDEIKLLKRLGNGAYAEAFLVEFAHAEACLKLFQSKDIGGSSNEGFEDFEKELELLSSISHPNIVTFIGCLLKLPRIGILLEYCSNGNLSDRIDEIGTGIRRNDPISKRIDWLLQISGALSYLHKRNIIHRDLKLENILLNRTNEIRLCDFGLSRAIEKNSKTKTMTSRVGTSIYIAPEVTLGEKYSTKCDVFSFSIIMYQLLTLRLSPYGKRNENGIEYQVAKKRLRPSINQNDPNFQKLKWYIELMKKCWSEDQNIRPNMEEIQTILSANYTKGKTPPEIPASKPKTFKKKTTISFQQQKEILELKKQIEILKREKQESLKILKKENQDLKEEIKQLKNKNSLFLRKSKSFKKLPPKIPPKIKSKIPPKIPSKKRR